MRAYASTLPGTDCSRHGGFRPMGIPPVCLNDDGTCSVKLLSRQSPAHILADISKPRKAQCSYRAFRGFFQKRGDGTFHYKKFTAQKHKRLHTKSGTQIRSWYGRGRDGMICFSLGLAVKCGSRRRIRCGRPCARWLRPRSRRSAPTPGRIRQRTWPRPDGDSYRRPRSRYPRPQSAPRRP